MQEVIIGLEMVVILTLVVCTYSLRKLYLMVMKMKLKLLQSNMSSRIIYKNMQVLENKMASIHASFTNSDNKPNSSSGDTKDKIEYQYERARKILKNGLADEQDILQSCNITLEEVELLSGLVGHEDSL
jgi:hypothetical protein